MKSFIKYRLKNSFNSGLARESGVYFKRRNRRKVRRSWAELVSRFMNRNHVNLNVNGAKRVVVEIFDNNRKINAVNLINKFAENIHLVSDKKIYRKQCSVDYFWFINILLTFKLGILR